MTFVVLWLMMISSYNIYGQKEKGQKMSDGFDYDGCAYSVKIDLTIYNILTEYRIFPNDLRTQTFNLGVKFDFARQVDSDEDIIFQSDYRWRDSPGVSDPYLACNHVYTQVNTGVSHSAILRFFGTGTPKINLSLLPNAANAVYQFRYDQPLNQWRLLRRDSSGNTTLGPFNYIPDPSNPSIEKWILIDPTKVQIEINSSITLMNQDGYRFVVNNSLN